MIAIIDYGLGNPKSVANMLNRLGIENTLTADPAIIASASKLILPGVGHFKNGMDNLRASNLIEPISEKVLVQNTPILGICLGMQLLCSYSDEGEVAGLGWIDAHVKKFQIQDRTMKIPHMGWNYISVKNQNPFFQEGTESRYYFVHSYYVECKNQNNVIAACDYFGEFAAVISNGQIYGTQFHPEKSHKYGMDLLEKFSNL